MKTKICFKCKTKKPLSDFNKDKGRRDGRGPYCRICHNKVQRKNYQENKEKNVLRAKKYQKENPEKVQATRKRYYQNHKEKIRIESRENSLRRTYGLSIKKHKEIYLIQNGCCPVCGKSVPYDKIETDHCHSSGRVRGLLCKYCNVKLGAYESGTVWYEENKEAVEKYLK